MEIIFRLISFLFLIISITLHEFFHSLAADYLGDPTPRSLGRLTLNPKAHLDPFGTIILPLINIFTGIPTIGWAKPVPIDPFNFRHPRRDEIIVSLAGPFANLTIAITTALILRFIPFISPIIYQLGALMILINISLFVFNLLPIPPLDGSHIFLNLLSPESSHKWAEAFDHYGFVLLIIFVFLPIYQGQTILSLIVSPLTKSIFHLLLPTL
ncbi:MAG TPA: site-2 protease family protein [Candidatus Woesebacteria bacterium]|jgi:Zn-dependent protease|nr:site-2 protease family protein [Candidatus Shapirobacteria bacterium]HOG37785.1 site-2 protease family protein [Candidatus Woesebacteria bacterium]HOR02014.1 site-2 protease family protein [Candidatus Woesebacteria bacterium]